MLMCLSTVYGRRINMSAFLNLGMISTLNSVVSGAKLLDFFSTPYAIGLYVAILMILVATLAGCVLLGLHLVRKNTEDASVYALKNSKFDSLDSES